MLSSFQFSYVFPELAEAVDGTSVDADSNPVVHRVMAVPGILSPEECRTVIDLGAAHPAIDAVADGADERLRRYRAGHIAWIRSGAASEWLYERMAELVHAANERYQFELLGFADPLQFTVYGSDQYFDWHVDIGPGAAALRKLSVSVQLTDGAEYDGGDLEFPWAGDSAQHRAIGTAIVFPSFLAHRVSPVTRGMRRSLVAWACGPTFR